MDIDIATGLLLSEYVAPDDSLLATLNPRKIAEPILEWDEHADIRSGEAMIEWLFRREPKKKGGRWVLGTCYAPSVNGDLSPLFDWMLGQLFGRLPDFLIVLDWNYWWGASALEREILVAHELCHAVQAKDDYGTPRFDRSGAPIWSIRAHDIEEFFAITGRYGAHSRDIQGLIAALEGDTGVQDAHPASGQGRAPHGISVRLTEMQATDPWETPGQAVADVSAVAPSDPTPVTGLSDPLF